MTEIALNDLAAVVGGLDENQLRSLAAEKCPQTYQQLKGKKASDITRADANACVAEWKPNFLIRGTVEGQIDDYFKSKGQ